MCVQCQLPRTVDANRKPIDMREMLFFHIADGNKLELWDAKDVQCLAQQLGGDQLRATATT